MIYFYKVILNSWLELWIWQVNSSWLDLFFVFLIDFFKSHLIDWELNFKIYFNFFYKIVTIPWPKLWI